MRKVYRMENLDCANCAAKMERAIQKIRGVSEAEVSFMAQKLVLECEEAKLAEILEQVKLCVAKVDRNCKVIGI